MSDVYKKALKVIEDNIYFDGMGWEYNTEKPGEMLYALGFIGGIIEMAKEVEETEDE